MQICLYLRVLPGSARISQRFPVPITHVPWSRRLLCLQRAMKPGKGRPKRRQVVVFCLNNCLSLAVLGLLCCARFS